jgi:hypothetical protein
MAVGVGVGAKSDSSQTRLAVFASLLAKMFIRLVVGSNVADWPTGGGPPVVIICVHEAGPPRPLAPESTHVSLVGGPPL